MMIERYIKTEIIQEIQSDVFPVIIVYGARQIGKTTLCQEIVKTLNWRTRSINADEGRYIEILSSRDSRQLLSFIEDIDLLFIDEAQRVPEIGINLKILADQAPHLKILATGSSSFELANRIQEPLTGRKRCFQLYPISQLELKKSGLNRHELEEGLDEYLIWGSYPKLFQIKGLETKRIYLKEIVQDYLFKDILTLVNIQSPLKLRQLLKLLAYQIGNEVSIHELATQLKINQDTVERYLDLLEKSFVIVRLNGFSRNLRKEISKKSKFYFYDLGIRNSLIDHFDPASHRQDMGALWENFLTIERMKKNHYQNHFASSYFWRLYSGAEIDYIEEHQNQLHGFEFKWNKKRKKRAPAKWQESYKNADWTLVNPENYLEFVS